MYYGKNSKGEIRVAKGLLLGCFVLLVMVSTVHGGVGQRPAGVAAGASTEPADTPTGVTEVGVFTDGRLSLIAFEKDTAIKDAIRVLAALYKKNIVPSPNITGTLSFTRLRDVTFEDAMEAILGENFKYEQKGSLTKVFTKEEYTKRMEDPERMVYEVFTLYYISAAEAKKLITPLKSKSGVIETTTAAVTTFPTGESISSITGGGDTPAMHDTVIVYDFPENIEAIREVLREVDIRPKQVLIEATILSISLNEDMELGVDWRTLQGTVTGISGMVRGMPDFLMSEGVSQVGATGGLTIGTTEENVGVFIRALEEVTDITVLANPKILAVNKQLGQVYIGDKFGYREGDTFDPQGNRVEGEVKFLDTGTKLSFRPYIANDGYIRMDIHPKDSDGSVPGGIPQETSAELVTNILVKDGQTIIIGGLFRDKVTTGRTQIPVLGNLPILGAVFRGTSDIVERQEVMVLLTPHIVGEPGDLDGLARAEDVRRKRFGAKDSLQGMGRAKFAEELYAQAAKHYIAGDHETAMRRLKIALTLRPTYLEAIRLKERIIAETNPDEVERLERIILEDIDRQEASKWLRW
jgi:type IV pilus assembly protein PilQ